MRIWYLVAFSSRNADHRSVIRPAYSILRFPQTVPVLLFANQNWSSILVTDVSLWDIYGDRSTILPMSYRLLITIPETALPLAIARDFKC